MVFKIDIINNGNVKKIKDHSIKAIIKDIQTIKLQVQLYNHGKTFLIDILA